MCGKILVGKFVAASCLDSGHSGEEGSGNDCWGEWCVRLLCRRLLVAHSPAVTRTRERRMARVLEVWICVVGEECSRVDPGGEEGKQGEVFMHQMLAGRSRKEPGMTSEQSPSYTP